MKSPKLYFADSGLVCHLLGIASESELARSPFLGPLFEGFLASEIVKQQLNAGRRKEIYYFRDQQGLEVDFLVPTGDRRLLLLEAKASRTVTPAMAEPLVRLARAVRQYDTRRVIVHRGVAEEALTAIRPGVSAMSVDRFLASLPQAGRSRRPGVTGSGRRRRRP